MNIRRLIHNAVTAFFVQGISMIVSLVTSLLVPKMLGVESFGYWQLFILYSMYAQFFMLGLFDGIYLTQGGKERSELDLKSVNTQYVLGMIAQALIGLGIAALAVFTSSNVERIFVVCSFSVYLVLHNMTLALGYIFQAVNETRIFSYSVMLDRVAFLIPLVALLAIGTTDFHLYIIFYIIAKGFALVYCLWNARDILTSGFYSFCSGVSMCTRSISVGVRLSIAVMADTLILGIARMLIDFIWDIEVFGQVSFALSMLNFFVAFVAQACMVLFPALRQSQAEELKMTYRFLRNAMELFLPALYVFYVPITSLMGIWLPQYETSMIYFAIVLPICVFDCKMNICGSTYMKVLREERFLLHVNIMTVIMSTVLCVLGASVLHSIESILLGVVTAIIVRAMISETWLNRKLGIERSRMARGELLLTVSFLTLAMLLESFVTLVGYTLLYALYLIHYRCEIHSIWTHIPWARRSE